MAEEDEEEEEAVPAARGSSLSGAVLVSLLLLPLLAVVAKQGLGLALGGDQGQHGRARPQGCGGVTGQRGQGHVQKLDEMIEECFVVW